MATPQRSTPASPGERTAERVVAGARAERARWPSSDQPLLVFPEPGLPGFLMAQKTWSQVPGATVEVTV